jgi:hypothetical protein
LIQIADNAMYQAKAAGTGRCVIARLDSLYLSHNYFALTEADTCLTKQHILYIISE